MAPTIGRLALDNGFHGSIPGDWVAPPPQNIHIVVNPSSCYLIDFLDLARDCPWHFPTGQFFQSVFEFLHRVLMGSALPFFCLAVLPVFLLRRLVSVFPLS